MQRLALSISVIALLLSPVVASADDAKELKILANAKVSTKERNIGPVVLNKLTPVIIRSAEELAAATQKAKSAKDADVQKEIEAEVAKLLKVDAIDWKKQMIVAGVAESFDSAKSDGKVLTVTFTKYVERPTRAVLPWPKVMSLVERFEGEVKFVPKETKDKK